MPIYVYEVITKDNSEGEQFEIFQVFDDRSSWSFSSGDLFVL